MALKQGHQPYHEIVDPEEGNNHAKYERYSRNSVWEKGNAKGFFFQMKKYANRLP